MNITMNGKLVQHIEYDEGRGFVGVGSGPVAKMWFSATHHGDRDEFWVVAESKDGTELFRYNANKLLSITWAPT